MTLSNAHARMLSALPERLRAAASQRFSEREEALREHLAALYGADPALDAWFSTLMETIGRLHGQRPAALHALDAARSAEPGWFTRQSMLGYSAYVPQFGGTLRGVIGRIEHLRELGVTYLHLLPFLRPRAGENDGGFAVASFDEVDPALGSTDDLLALTAALREAGISLCSDLVLNHVADDHPWALGAAAGDPALRQFFHIFPDQSVPERYEQVLGQVFPQAAPGNFTYVDAVQGWVWTTFYPFQWDLNYANPAVLGEMVLALLRLANRGVEVFRLDSTAFLWKREGSSCMNQPEAHQLLQVIRALVDIAAPGVLLKAEAIVPTRALPAYFGSGAQRECHLAYHSTLMTAGWAALAEQDTALLQAVIDATPALPPEASWLTYVRCHDDIGWNVLRAEAGDDARLASIARFYADGDSFAAGVAFQTSGTRAVHGTNGSAAALAGIETAINAEQRELGVRRLLLLYALALSFGGLPVLYMGDELGMQNDHTYLLDASRAHDTRWVQRAPFDERLFAERADASAVTGELYRRLGELIAARRRLPALAADAPRSVLAAADPALLALARGERFLSLSNFSGLPLVVSLAALQAGAWPGYADQVVLQPWAMLWLER
ncbi:alpha-amylase family glycosyl hydrolase [Massilia sp. TWP1-3-3]|uniref:alpha-amylase family glycosyl hydrolase n=1 Tax=Massilia sp. TWP1-3-3 TaxID=2804573 RepID=UPI003CF59047